MRQNTAVTSPSAGITLTELFVILLILALLAGILVPLLGGSRERAAQTKCASHLRQMGIAFSLYAADFDGSFPCPGGRSTRVPWLQSTDRGFNKDAPGIGIWPYIQKRSEGTDNLYSCPLSLHGQDDTYSPGQNYVMNDYLRPCHPGQDRIGNQFKLCGGSSGKGDSPYDKGVRLSDLPSHGEQVILLYESTQHSLYHSVNRNGSPFFSTGRGATPPLCMGMPQSYHSGQSNFLFCDGHVQAMTPGATWRPADQEAFVRFNFGPTGHPDCRPVKRAVLETGKYTGNGPRNLWSPDLPRVTCP